MSQVKKLIIDIRDTLNDPNGDRWDNDRLIRALNEAMLDVNLEARLIRAKALFTLEGGVSTYQLDSSVQLLTRCVANGISIPFKSHAEMDEFSETWESDTGDTLSFIVYDKLNRGVIRVYPTPTSSVGDVTPEFGVITEIESFNLDGLYGVLTDFTDPVTELVLYYIKKPTIVDEQEDEICFDDVWDKALKHYVCGMTLRADKDTQNRQFGNEELQLYTGALASAKDNSSNNFTEAGQYETDYRSL